MPRIDARLCLCIAALAAVLLPARIVAQDWKEIYQDFRGGKALGDEWKFIGSQKDQEGISKEEKGLRIVIPRTRTKPHQEATQPVGIRLRFPLSGDFEITGRYEIIALEKPPPGANPVGVAFNLVVANDHKKMAKLGRFMRSNDGDVHLAETWMPGGDGPTRPVKTIPAKGSIGQARLIRQGDKVSYLVANDDGKFVEIFNSQLSDEDLEIVRFGANNNAAPALVDVRIIDVRIRPLAPVAADGPKVAPPSGEQAVVEQGTSRGGWVVAITIIGIVVLLLLAGLVGGVILVMRQRKK